VISATPLSTRINNTFSSLTTSIPFDHDDAYTVFICDFRASFQLGKLKSCSSNIPAGYSYCVLFDRIRLRHLRTFVAISTGGSLVKAAETLSITQPAVTKTLADLEDILGKKLVVRTGRGGVRLTSNGQTFLRYAGSSLRTLGEGLDAIGHGDAVEVPSIAVGALPGVGATILPKAIKKYMEEVPNARARIRSGTNAYLISLLRQGELDLMIGRMAEPSEMRGLSFESLYTESLVFAVRPCHPLLLRRRLTPAMLLNYHLLMPDRGTRTREPAERFFVAAGLSPPDLVIESIDPSFARSYVMQTDTIWCSPAGVVENDVLQGALVRLALNTSVTTGEVGITLCTDHDRSEDLELMLKGIRLAASERYDWLLAYDATTVGI
jgi:LysR family pca operon transcriptional activator